MIDLHLHTTISDSTWEPAEVVQRAKALGLNSIAITDHERVTGIDMAKDAAKDIDMEIIPGIEFFSLYGDFEVHILGYFIDYKSDSFREYLDSLEEIRAQQNRVMLDKIEKNLGIKIAYEKLFEFSVHGFASRAQIARALVDVGFIKNTQEAFTKELLANGGKCFAPITKAPPEFVIKKIIEYGGIPVLAHPGYSGEIDLDEDEIAKFKEMGIMGLECRHMRHSPAMIEYFENVAKKLGLLKTGGSDCHGEIYNPVKIGTVEVPDSWLSRLKEVAGVSL
ncbi:MAG: PHP domain-containing protein [Candidatus Zixiibacteriota bacterium]